MSRPSPSEREPQPSDNPRVLAMLEFQHSDGRIDLSLDSRYCELTKKSMLLDNEHPLWLPRDLCIARCRCRTRDGRLKLEYGHHTWRHAHPDWVAEQLLRIATWAHPPRLSSDPPQVRMISIIEGWERHHQAFPDG